MKNKKNIKGFTLIELLVVVAIIGVLAAVGVTAFQGFTDNAKKQAMKSIHNGLVKSISAELKKCSIGNTTFMNGTSRTGATYSRPCSTNNTTMAAYARDGAINTSKDKDPWATANYAAVTGSSYVKGRTYIWASGSTVNLRSCWADGCGANDRQQDTIQVE
jgi:type IV pilus assembly protein PilA